MKQRSDGSDPRDHHYFRFWNGCLTNLLGWSNDDVVAWADFYLVDWHDEYGWVYHDNIEDAVVPMLISWRLRDRYKDRMELERRVGEAILPTLLRQQGAHVRSDYDWDAAKRRVELLLNSLGGSLAEAKADRKKWLTERVYKEPLPERHG